MSIVELRWWVEGHITFLKQDIFHNLGGTTPEVRSGDAEIPQEGAIAPPTTADVGGMEPHPTATQGADDTILVSPRCTPKDKAPPAEPTTSSAEANAKDTLPGSAETPPGDNTMVPLAEVNTKTLKDLLTDQTTSPAKAESQVLPTTGSYQAEEERQCVLTETASMGRLNLEATGVTPGDTVIASVRRVALRNSHMAAALPGPPKERKAVGHQDATTDKLAEKDFMEGHL